MTEPPRPDPRPHRRGRRPRWPTAAGSAAVSMRSVGRELGVEAMSLYHHISGKDDLLDALADWVFTGIELPTPDQPWRPAMSGKAASAREPSSRAPVGARPHRVPSQPRPGTPAPPRRRARLPARQRLPGRAGRSRLLGDRRLRLRLRAHRAQPADGAGRGRRGVRRGDRAADRGLPAPGRDDGRAGDRARTTPTPTSSTTASTSSSTGSRSGWVGRTAEDADRPVVASRPATGTRSRVCHTLKLCVMGCSPGGRGRRAGVATHADAGGSRGARGGRPACRVDLGYGIRSRILSHLRRYAARRGRADGRGARLQRHLLR